MPDRSPGGRAVDVEHRAIGICLGPDEVEYEGRGEPGEKREPVSQRHRLNHQPVLVNQAAPGERLREGGTSPRDQVLARLALETRSGMA